jgi:2-keto-3-deoxy-6-phosphogluconate aldolase
MPETTAQTIERVGLIPVLRARNSAQAHAVVKAMLAGGVTVVEVTMTVPGAIDVLKELSESTELSCCSAPAPSRPPIRPRPPSTPARNSS